MEIKNLKDAKRFIDDYALGDKGLLVRWAGTYNPKSVEFANFTTDEKKALIDMYDEDEENKLKLFEVIFCSLQHEWEEGLELIPDIVAELVSLGLDVDNIMECDVATENNPKLFRLCEESGDEDVTVHMYCRLGLYSSINPEYQIEVMKNTKNLTLKHEIAGYMNDLFEEEAKEDKTLKAIIEPNLPIIKEILE